MLLDGVPCSCGLIGVRLGYPWVCAGLLLLLLLFLRFFLLLEALDAAQVAQEFGEGVGVSGARDLETLEESDEGGEAHQGVGLARLRLGLYGHGVIIPDWSELYAVATESFEEATDRLDLGSWVDQASEEVGTVGEQLLTKTGRSWVVGGSEPLDEAVEEGDSRAVVAYGGKRGEALLGSSCPIGCRLPLIG
ncbi:MAG: hypothetical protein D6812_07570 [Deltaproteobacteria bacterium]|nr:MAG: hypothetical protein D6812_07570 [Deltaproteobacteria bacterium]